MDHYCRCRTRLSHLRSRNFGTSLCGPVLLTFPTSHLLPVTGNRRRSSGGPFDIRGPVPEEPREEVKGQRTYIVQIEKTFYPEGHFWSFGRSVQESFSTLWLLKQNSVRAMWPQDLLCQLPRKEIDLDLRPRDPRSGWRTHRCLSWGVTEQCNKSPSSLLILGTTGCLYFLVTFDYTL